MAGIKFLEARNVVQFYVTIDGERRECEVTLDALTKQFGATRNTAMTRALTHIDQLAAVAGKKANGEAGSIIALGVADF